MKRPPSAAAVVAALSILAGACASASPPARSGGNGNGATRAGSAMRFGGGAIRLEGQAWESASGGRADERRLLTREELELRVDGRLLDARFLQYALAGTLGALQIRDLEGDLGSKSRTLEKYQAHADLFPERTVSVALDANRNEDATFAAFLDSFGIQATMSEEYGVRARARGERASGEIGFRTMDYRTTGTVSGPRTMDRDEASGSFEARPGGTVRLSGSAMADAIRETVNGTPGAYDTNSADLRAEAGKLDRPGDILSLTTFMFREQTGDNEYENTSVTESLTGRAADWLDMGAHGSLSRSSTADSDTGSAAADAYLTGRAFRSLTGTVRGRGQKDDLDPGTSARRGASGSIEYRKETPVGLLTIPLEYGQDRQEDDAPAGNRTVLGEPHVLRSGDFVLLVHPDVVESTVVVRDGSGAAIYVRGIDYDLMARGRSTEIFRLSGGTIPDPGPVRVDYDYRDSGERVTTTTTQAAGVGLQVVPELHLSHRVFRTDQDLVSGDPTTLLEDRVSRMTALDWGTGNLGAGISYEAVESNVSPYRTRDVHAQWGADAADALRASLSARASRTSFDAGDDLDLATAEGLLRWRPGPAWTLEFRPGYRIERGRNGDRDLLDLRLDMRYDFRQLSVKLSLVRQQEWRDGTDRQESLATFTLERSF